MKGSGEHGPDGPPTWEHEFLEYLDGIISQRLRERAAPIAEDSAEEPTAGAPPESAQAGGVRSADSGLATTSVSSGVEDLDARLGGGFCPGLWTIAGASAVTTKAFLESVALENASNRRPVVYYALNESDETVRGRLLDALASIMTDSAEYGPSGRMESLPDDDPRAGLDSALKAAVLSNVWMFDSVPLSPDPVGAFLRSLEHTLDHVTSQTGPKPVVLIDDRTTLLRALHIQSAPGTLRAVAGLDGALLRRGSPVLMTALPDLAGLLTPEEAAKTRGLIQLGRGYIELLSRSTARVDAVIRENTQATWRGTVPLVFHSSVGMFTSAV